MNERYDENSNPFGGADFFKNEGANETETWNDDDGADDESGVSNESDLYEEINQYYDQEHIQDVNLIDENTPMSEIYSTESVEVFDPEMLVRESYKNAVKIVFAYGYTPKLFDIKTGSQYTDAPPPDNSVVVKATLVDQGTGQTFVNLYCSDSKNINKKPTKEKTGGKDWKKITILATAGLALVLFTAFASIFIYSKIEEGRTVVTPKLSGMTIERANEVLAENGLTVGNLQEINSLDAPEGVVLSQSPSAGASIKPSEGVSIIVSAGPKQISVPDLVGASEEQAKNTLTATNLTVGNITEKDSGEPVGTVVEQSVTAGSEVREGTEVSLVISNGKTAVPSVIGKTLEQASTELAEKGFKVKPVSVTQEGPAGTVIRQSPEANTFAAKDSEVEVSYSTPPVTLPDTPTPTPTP